MIDLSIELKVKDLEEQNWVVETPTLTQHERYPAWLIKTEAIYQQLVKDNSKFEYRPYQPEHAALYCLRRYNICNGDLGLGKTIEAGLAIAAIYDKPEKRRPGSIHILVTSRDAAITRWMVDLQCIKQLQTPGLIDFIDSEHKVVNSTAPIWIYTHDFPKNRSKTYTNKKNACISDLMLKSRRHPAMLVIDEIHNISSKTLRHDHVSKLCKKAKRKLGLTGTLSDGRLNKVHQCLKLIYGNRITESEREFVQLFTNKSKVKTNYLMGEDTDSEIKIQDRYLPGLSIALIPEYSRRRGRFIHRTKLSDPDIASVCKVPEPVFIPEFLEMGNEQEDIYRQVVKQIHPEIQKLVEYGTTKDRLKAMSLSHKLMQASSAPWVYGTHPDYVPAKLQRLLEIAEAARKINQKVVVFTNLVPVGGPVEKKLNAVFGNGACIRIYANDETASPKSLSKTDRTNRLETLMYGDNWKIGMFNIKLTNNSIDLTTVGSLVFWDIPWESIWVQQAIKRAVRPGSIFDSVNIHFLVNQKTICFHQYNLLIQKVKRANIIQDFDVSQISEGDLGQINPLEILKEIKNE